MIIETKEELFKYWKNLAKTPERLIEDFVSRHNLPTDNIDVLLRIVEYSVLLELAKLDPIYYNSK